MIIGVWIASGVVPAMIYYGFDVLLPAWFLPATFLLCSLMSLATGSAGEMSPSGRYDYVTGAKS
ncbi:MAG: hypothetical protein VR67_18860 [Peptococcaceae bacterium BRH_c8a]|nr:MAG: hypothetical protein VR67_18860 [Peptococcaceae bacterium BRH_c8a]